MKSIRLKLAVVLIFCWSETVMSGETKKHLYENNLILLHRFTGPLPIVDIKLFINCGSINESPDKSGITNILQTMILKGTKNRTAEQIAVEIESMGGSISSESDEDYSCISISIGAKYFEKAIEILSDIFKYPVFPEDELKKEKIMTVAEIKTRYDSIFNVAIDPLVERMYRGHPYSRLFLGSEESVMSITREDLLNWYKKYYGVPNIVIVIVGNVNFSTAKKTVSKYFSDIRKVGETKTVIAEPWIDKIETIRIKKDFEQAFLAIGFLAPRATDNEYPVFKVLNAYMGSGMSSFLFQELREKAGLCYETSSFYPTRKDISRFILYLGLDKKNIKTANDKIKKIIEEIIVKKISQDRLKDVKNYIKGVYILDHQTNSRQAWYLGWWEIMGKGYEYDDRYLNEIEKVSPDDIIQVAKKYLNKNYISVEVIPEK